MRVINRWVPASAWTTGMSVNNDTREKANTENYNTDFGTTPKYRASVCCEAGNWLVGVFRPGVRFLR